MTTTMDPPVDEGRPAGDDPVEDLTATGLDHADLADGEGAEELERPASPRLAVAVAFPVLAAAIMVGGIFKGVSPRLFCAVAGLLGVALGLLVARMRRPVLGNVVLVVGLFVIGLLMVVPGGADDVARVGDLARRAAREADLTRPPVPFDQGWHAISGWLMAIVGFCAAWVSLVLRRPSLALLLPLPFAAIAAISVPESQQVASGLAGLVLFAIGLGLLSSEQALGDTDEHPPLSYEIRKAVKALPLIGAITVALFALTQVDFLFPASAIDPAKEPQEPEVVPIQEVEDRPLFEVTSALSGPWRMGVLDEYVASDGSWRLPAFAENELADVPDDGVVDRSRQQAVRAEFVLRGLGGAVLPGIQNPVGIVARGLGSPLQYDDRSGNIRLSEGQIEGGLAYTVVAAAPPSVSELQDDTRPIPPEIERFTELPDPPPAVVRLLTEATTGFDNQWDRFDFLRTYVLDNVVATGVGSPVAVPVERVQEILGDTLEASPYEIVALQAMLARWAGVPARIGYGFDGGTVLEGQTLEVRPANGASFPEVYFGNFGWLPVIGVPRQAEPTVGGDPSTQQIDPAVLPSGDIASKVFLPVLVPPGSVLGKQILMTLAVVMPLALVALLVYTLFPAIVKARSRSRRRAAALAAGPRARIALAYAEWRDLATDYGFKHNHDTPLMYLDRFIDDDEHTELAWLTTRALWGDLRHDVTVVHATGAEELARSLRRRLGASQPGTLRAVAVVSRLSLKDPFAPGADLTEKSHGRSRRRRRRAAGEPGADVTGKRRGRSRRRHRAAEKEARRATVS